MATMKNSNYRYFLYSQSHVNEQNEILSKIGKEFVCGTVITGNKKQTFSFMGVNPDMGARYPDCKVVAEGSIADLRYTMPTSQHKGI